MFGPIDLKIFHYHFHTGGVTTVVRQALEAFREHLPGIRSVEAVAGDIPAAFRSSLDRQGGGHTEMPEIGYRQPEVSSAGEVRKNVAREADRLVERLVDSFGSENSVWWVHNYHLGKNVVFTQALLRIIHSDRAQRVILQIHDFPECGRFSNLGQLREGLSLDPYPVSPWVRYAVLNPRDREILTGAGIPQQNVFLLENPVLRTPDTGREEAGPVRSMLKRFFGDTFPRFDPRAPLLFYPIRTIRRKNVLEALLLCVLMDRGANLLVTLPGVSASELRYSQLVEGLFADRLCPGLWGVGGSLEKRAMSFGNLVSASDLVLSTSVQEGFGYLFVNSLLWSMPLAARDLDSLAGLKDLFGGYPARFYGSVRVPPPETEVLREAYRSKIESLTELIPPETAERLLTEVDELGRDGAVDFSFLSVQAQENLLREVAAGSGRVNGFCRRENRATLETIEELLTTGRNKARDAAGSKAAAIDGRFGSAAYAGNFRRILEAFGTGSRHSPRSPNTGIAAEVLQAFLQLEHLRLLYDY